MSNVDDVRTSWERMNEGQHRLPETVRGMVQFFGGDTKGVSAMAHQIVAERQAGRALGTTNYKSVRRSVERYVTEKEGAQKRGVSGRETELVRQARGAAERQATARDIARNKRAGGFRPAWSAVLHISRRGGHRTYSGHEGLSAADLDAAGFYDAIRGGDWGAAYQAFERVMFSPDGPYGGVPADTAFEEIEEIAFYAL